MMNTDDISPDWQGSTAAEREAIDRVLKLEGTPLAVVMFYEVRQQLGHYWYWFVLSTLWISYSGYSNLRLWRKLFRASRPRRKSSLMKPSELRAFRKLPDRIDAYRAHRPDETDWISYTTDRQIAERWARERGGYVASYILRKSDCLALFLRRGESELLMLEPRKAIRRKEMLE